MPCDDLRDWIKVLDKAGELRRIREQVSPLLEIAEITDRVCKSGFSRASKSAPGGPALLFENVTGHPGARVLMNQFGSERRMKLALGLDPDKARSTKSPAASARSWKSNPPKACSKS